jgi:spermidine synthase
VLLAEDDSIPAPPAARRHRSLAFGATVFLTSAAALVVEIVAGRLIAPYVGMSLYTWTAIIAVVLAGLSVGHWIGGHLAGPAVDARAGALRVAGALAAASATTLLALPLLRLLAALLVGGDRPLVSIVLLAGTLFLAPSLFVGIVSPVLTKLAVDAEPSRPGRAIGRMYALGAAGSILGTLAAGYLFISWIGTTGTMLAVTALYAALAVSFAVAARHAAAPVALVVALAGAGVWAARTDALTSPCLAESDYYCIRVVDFSADSGRPSAVMVIDHLGHSINDRDDPALLYSPYLHLVDELMRRRTNGAAPAAFFIGGGGFTLPRAWASERADARLIVAEIDPAVTAAARDHMWFDPLKPGLDVRHADARRALQELPRAPLFDVVLGDAFHDVSIPAHLVTREFHREIAARLKPDGFYAINVIEDIAAPRFLFALVRTMQLDFAAVEVWLDEDSLRDGGRVTFVAFGAAEPNPAARVESRRKIGRRWLRWPQADLDERIAAAAVPVMTDDYAPVDRLMSHLLLTPDPNRR